jgi:hypothetical protein
VPRSSLSPYSRTPTTYQYYESNVMHFSFNLLIIKGRYTFRALLAHSQEALHKRHLVYCVRIMSVVPRLQWGGAIQTALGYIVCVCQLAVPRLQWGGAIQTALGYIVCVCQFLCHDCSEEAIHKRHLGILHAYVSWLFHDCSEEALHKRHLGILHAYLSWLCHDRSETEIVAQPNDTTRTQYTKWRL